MIVPPLPCPTSKDTTLPQSFLDIVFQKDTIEAQKGWMKKVKGMQGLTLGLNWVYVQPCLWVRLLNVLL